MQQERNQREQDADIAQGLCRPDFKGLVGLHNEKPPDSLEAKSPRLSNLSGRAGLFALRETQIDAECMRIVARVTGVE